MLFDQLHVAADSGLPRDATAGLQKQQAELRFRDALQPLFDLQDPGFTSVIASKWLATIPDIFVSTFRKQQFTNKQKAPFAGKIHDGPGRAFQERSDVVKK